MNKKFKIIQKIFSPHIIVTLIFFGINATKIHAIDSLFVGIGPVVNAYSRGNAAVGSNLVFGMIFDSNFSAGIKTGFSNDFNTI